MNQTIFLIQSTLGVSFIVLAFAAVARIKILTFLTTLLPKTRRGRLLSSVLFLVTGVACFISTMIPFAVFFASCLALLAAAFLMRQTFYSKRRQLWSIPLLIAIGSIAAVIAQPLGLKVLALPKADDLPIVPVPTRVVKTYDEGLWFEGITASSDGTLYLAGNRNLNFARSDYYREAQGEVIMRSPDGIEHVLFKTPAGSTAGVLTVSATGTLYMTSHSEASVIWKIGADGQSKKLAQLPPGSWPNGIDLGPDNMLYSPDSALGIIWQINPDTGNAKPIIEDKLLLARPFIALAPGANGLHFKGRDMYVTVSDRTIILKYTLGSAGQFGTPTVVATGIPGDDFAIGRDGSLFVTTHPYNTIVRVAPDGIRTIIGNQDQRIIGATDAVFGNGADDRDTLYVVTDGGAFTGGPKTRGELIALRPFSQK